MIAAIKLLYSAMNTFAIFKGFFKVMIAAIKLLYSAMNTFAIFKRVF